VRADGRKLRRRGLRMPSRVACPRAMCCCRSSAYYNQAISLRRYQNLLPLAVSAALSTTFFFSSCRTGFFVRSGRTDGTRYWRPLTSITAARLSAISAAAERRGCQHLLAFFFRERRMGSPSPGVPCCNHFVRRRGLTAAPGGGEQTKGIQRSAGAHVAAVCASIWAWTLPLVATALSFLLWLPWFSKTPACVGAQLCRTACTILVDAYLPSHGLGIRDCAHLRVCLHAQAGIHR